MTTEPFHAHLFSFVHDDDPWTQHSLLLCSALLGILACRTVSAQNPSFCVLMYLCSSPFSINESFRFLSFQQFLITKNSPSKNRMAICLLFFGYSQSHLSLPFEVLKIICNLNVINLSLCVCVCVCRLMIIGTYLYT